jgi:hypothetical protein
MTEQNWKRQLLGVAAMILLVGGLATAADALAITKTASGPNTTGQLVSASVEFRTSTGQINIFVTNSLANPVSIAQVLTNLQFHLTTGQTTGTLTGEFGRARTIGKGETFTTGTSNLPTTDLTLTSGFSYNYDGGGVTGFKLSALGTRNPEHGIIGPPDPSDTLHYTAANSSIAGSGPHNPFLWNTTSDSTGIAYPTGALFPNGAVHFVMNVTGVTDLSSVDEVVFSWGTAEGNYLEVPLPGSLLTFGSGLMATVWLARRRRRTRCHRSVSVRSRPDPWGNLDPKIVGSPDRRVGRLYNPRAPGGTPSVTT